MALSLRSLFVLLTLVLLPLTAHAQATGGGSGSGAATVTGPSGIGPNAAPILAPQAPTVGNQGANFRWMPKLPRTCGESWDLWIAVQGLMADFMETRDQPAD